MSDTHIIVKEAAQKMMECLYCSGNLKKSKEVFHVDRNGIHLTIDQLGVYKCEICGEILVETQEVELNQKILSQLDDALAKRVA